MGVGLVRFLLDFAKRDVVTDGRGSLLLGLFRAAFHFDYDSLIQLVFAVINDSVSEIFLLLNFTHHRRIIGAV